MKKLGINFYSLSKIDLCGFTYKICNHNARRVFMLLEKNGQITEIVNLKQIIVKLLGIKNDYYREKNLKIQKILKNRRKYKSI